MNERNRNFNTYELGDNVYQLANGLLQEITEVAGYDISTDPTESELRGLVAKLGPDKELQQNISTVETVLGKNSDEIITGWIERSGMMLPLDRRFSLNQPSPEFVDSAVFSGGVANWMLRRGEVLKRLDPEKVGEVVLSMGNRKMGLGEHQLVTTWAKSHDGQRPTEAEFAREYIVGSLALSGFQTEIFAVDSGNGDEVLDVLFSERPALVDKAIAVIGNAPNAIQAAGQLRLAGRRAHSKFDDEGEQVSMLSDSFPIANHGELPAFAQNPKTALGQLARNALILFNNQQS